MRPTGSATYAFGPRRAHLSIECDYTASQIETPICTRCATTHQFIWQQKSVALGGSPWNAERLNNTTKLRTFIPDVGTYPPGTALPRTAWVNRLCTGVGRFNSCLHKYGSFCGLWMWGKGTNRLPCCPPMSNPLTSPWTARPDCSGRWDNRLVAQHLDFA